MRLIGSGTGIVTLLQLLGYHSVIVTANKRGVDDGNQIGRCSPGQPEDSGTIIN